MSKLHLICTFVFLLILAIEVKLSPASARLKALSAQQHRRGLQESRPGEKNTLAVELTSFDHIKSPFFRTNITKKERALMAVRRSHLRRQSLMGKPVGQGKVFNLPLAHGNQSEPQINTDIAQGNYLTEISIGTPPRKVTAIADTASDLTYVNCKGCKECSKKEDAFFNSSASTTYTKIRCQDPKCLSTYLSEYWNGDIGCPPNATGPCEVYEYTSPNYLGPFSGDFGIGILSKHY